MYLLGQICGVIGTIITIIQPQFQKKGQMLLCCILVNGMNALNFGLIGQTGSAVFLCSIAIMQAMVSIWHERRRTEISSMENILFFFLYVGFGFYGMITSEGFVWGINEHNLLDENVIIVDEVSMMDEPLTAALLRAIKPGARLVLIGDADQLPPVGAGDAFRDIIGSGCFKAVSLTDIFRQAKGSSTAPPMPKVMIT